MCRWVPKIQHRVDGGLTWRDVDRKFQWVYESAIRSWTLDWNCAITKVVSDVTAACSRLVRVTSTVSLDSFYRVRHVVDHTQNLSGSISRDFSIRQPATGAARSITVCCVHPTSQQRRRRGTVCVIINIPTIFSCVHNLTVWREFRGRFSLFLTVLLSCLALHTVNVNIVLSLRLRCTAL